MHGVSEAQVLTSGTRRDLTPALKKLLRRRSAVEPEIGHMKNRHPPVARPADGHDRCAIFVVRCGCGHNIRKILARLGALLALILAAVSPAVRPEIRLSNALHRNETVAAKRYCQP